MRGVYSSLIEKAQNRGEILNRTPPDLLVDTIVYIADGIALVWCSQNGDFDYIEESKKPFLSYQDPENYIDAYKEFYDSLVTEE